jgi:hypothetical protein
MFPSGMCGFNRWNRGSSGYARILRTFGCSSVSVRNARKDCCKKKLVSTSELRIYIWSGNSSPNSEGKMEEIEEILDVSSSPFLLFLSARLARSWQGECRNFVF